MSWWKSTTVYQIYPRSFSDSNGDGIGDLQGVIERLDYLERLGVETLWMSPFYRSPQADFGYDISDYFSVAPEYGTREDAQRLIEAVHARGMKIVFDMVLNHTSEQHPWFLDSKSSTQATKRDWYIWRDGRKAHGKAPPNNWRSMLGGSGWHYDAATEQWYWASFLPFQPDLNYRNPEVKAAMLEVVRYWFHHGVDGLRLDVFNALYKDASFADNPRSLRLIPTEDNPHGFFQRNLHTIDHPDTLAFARELRAVADEYTQPPRFLVGEVFGSPLSLRRYCGADADGLHLVFLFKAMRTRLSARAVRELVLEIEQAFPEPYMPTYVFGNHDRPRLIHRLGDHDEKAKLLAMLQLTVRGVPFIYYGEEIGMRHHQFPLAMGLDPIAARFRFVPQWVANHVRGLGMLLNRDECRSPMQWDAGHHAGFALESAVPWLPLHPKAREINVAAQENQPDSLLSCYRGLLMLRKQSRALSRGRLELMDARELPLDVLGYRRIDESGESHETAYVFLNFSAHPRTLDLVAQPNARLFSSRLGETRTVRGSYVLSPHEGVLVHDLRDTSEPQPEAPLTW